MDTLHYIAIDLKSFYASVECIDRGLDPFTTNLVVADKSRTDKTICLAVSPALKAYGVPGRPRLFEVVQKVKEINRDRGRYRPPGEPLESSWDVKRLKEYPYILLDYIVAPPQMAKYMEISNAIYKIYLKYIAPEDIHVYSIDEVFIDASAYLKTYHMTAEQLTKTMIQDIFQTTGITATAGIGTNLYLCKVAMDIVAKHKEPDENGVRIAQLDEMSYRKLLWTHKPLTDFWRIGRGYEKKLQEVGIYTMGDIAKCSVGKNTDFYNEDLLYRLFGVNAELLIDHAWGWEPVGMKEIKKYRPATNSLSSGQVLQCPYEFYKAKIVVREMMDALALDLVGKGLVTDQIVLTIGYDRSNIKESGYKGEVKTDHYGRSVPKHAHGTVNLEKKTASSNYMVREITTLYEKIVDPTLLIRRITISVNRVIRKSEMIENNEYQQISLFDLTKPDEKEQMEKIKEEKEEKLQQAMITIKHRYGKNAILKGLNYEEGATGKERNSQIGGHRA